MGPPGLDEPGHDPGPPLLAESLLVLKLPLFLAELWLSPMGPLRREVALRRCLSLIPLVLQLEEEIVENAANLYRVG